MNHEEINNNESNPDQTEKAKNAFIEKFIKIAGRHKENTNEYEVVDDPKEASTDAMDYIKDDRALKQEFSRGAPTEVPATEGATPEPFNEQDLNDVTRLANENMSADDLIGAIDEANKQSQPPSSG